MNRFVVACFAVLFSGSIATAQTPVPDPGGPPASGAAPTTTASSAAEKPGVTETISPEILLFQQIDDKWSDAVNRRDQYGLELVLSPLFVDVSASGDVTTRNQQVALVLSGDDKTLYLTQKVVTVRMLGDTAVANGTYTLRHKVGSSLVDEKGIFTQVFERSRGGWLCINSQRTLLRQDAAKKKESAPEAPFHLPNPFSRGERGPQ
ncbi:MAG TPA: nuclear transport factor 2 family protein [Terracidiphilus sp.]|nr:nuclear transport factor 2 family protein [Terracidiphilus sp.]